jgi:hypothetical protein
VVLAVVVMVIMGSRMKSAAESQTKEEKLQKNLVKAGIRKHLKHSK